MPERKQKFALVNYQTSQIVHIFDQDTPTIAVPDHGDVKPSKGPFIGQYQIWDVRLAQSPDDLRVSPRGLLAAPFDVLSGEVFLPELEEVREAA
jgi:hypothetical protein